ncbi:hypothetical protein [uncultured Parasutterella sp.]
MQRRRNLCRHRIFLSSLNGQASRTLSSPDMARERSSQNVLSVRDL